MKEGREIEARKKREKERNARVAQLVERDLAKVEAAGSSPVSRFFYLPLVLQHSLEKACNTNGFRVICLIIVVMFIDNKVVKVPHEYHTIFRVISWKCPLIFLVCLTVSISIAFRYTDFIILSLDHPPRCRIYWSGTPMACMIDAA